MYYTYMIRCEDGSIYTGITTDLKRRLAEHRDKGRRCAKYTLTHTVTILEMAWQSGDRSTASRLEYRLKRLTKSQKEALIKSGELKDIFSDIIDCDEYTPYNK